MKLMGLYETYMQYVGRLCRFTQSSSAEQKRAILKINDAIATLCLKKGNYSSLAMPLLTLAIPSNDDVPWILKTQKDIFKAQ